MSKSKHYLFKKTKIVCTIGPASYQKKHLVELINHGMNVARLNCSHGDHETLAQWIKNIRDAEKETGIPVPIILDLQGPKIRIGVMKDHKPVEVVSGQRFTISTEEIEGDVNIVSTTYQDLPQAVNVGDFIFINDGLVRLEVEGKTETLITTVVRTGGIIADHKGINVPGVRFKRTGLTAKDKMDLEFGKKHGLEIIAISFVEQASDIVSVRKLYADEDYKPLIIAKIERLPAVENLDEILDAADGVMVARGDLGVEINLERVPLTQKDIIRKAIERNRLTIVATQMLESMTHNAMPTRAEVSDVANSILDNTDGIMLSAETAMGENPLLAVKMMSEIALEIEHHTRENKLTSRRRIGSVKNSTDAITWSAVEAAEALNVSKIVVFTNTGRAALSLSLRRPRQQILAFAPDLTSRRKMQIYHGVFPLEFIAVATFEQMLAEMETIGAEKGLWKKGENVIVISGPPGVTGGTNFLKVHHTAE